MHYNISFPNLGIYLDHVGKASASLVFHCLLRHDHRCSNFDWISDCHSGGKRTGQNPEDYLDMGIVGVIAGIAGARIYYVIFSWDYIKIIFCLSLISEKVVWQFMAA